MKQLLDRIAQLCDDNGISIYKLEKDCGLSINSISKWGVSTPLLDRVLRVAQYFDVSIDYLAGNTNNPKSHKQEYSILENKNVLSALSRLYYASIEFNEIMDKEHLGYLKIDNCGSGNT